MKTTKINIGDYVTLHDTKGREESTIYRVISIDVTREEFRAKTVNNDCPLIQAIEWEFNFRQVARIGKTLATFTPLTNA